MHKNLDLGEAGVGLWIVFIHKNTLRSNLVKNSHEILGQILQKWGGGGDLIVVIYEITLRSCMIVPT